MNFPRANFAIHLLSPAVHELMLIGIIGAAVLGTILGFIFRGTIRRQISRVGQRFINQFDRLSFFKTLEVFFHECAVLWAVFPLLDSLYDLEKGQQINPYLLLLSFPVAGVLLLFGVAFSKKLHDEETRIQG